MRKKDSEKIVNDLIEFIKGKLLDNYKNEKGRVIDSVQTLIILSFEIDEENEDRDKIIVTKVIAASRVWVKFVEDSKSSDNIQLRNNKFVEFVYDKETDEFKMLDSDVIFYIDSIY